VIAGVAFVNYVLLRLYGHRGLYWTAVLGGLVNNRAAIAELMGVASGTRLVSVMLLATLAMFVRNIAILALFAPRALLTATGPLLAMAVVSLLLLTGQPSDEAGRDLRLNSPISLRRVLSYGMLFLVIQAIGTLSARFFGNSGFMMASGITGMASSASASAAAANLSSLGGITPALAGTATVIASMTSALTNLPVVFKRVPQALLARIAFSTSAQVVVGIAALAAQRFLIMR